MRYRTMPKNNDELSILGFGCMRLPVTQDGQVDEPRAIQQIRYSIDKGINYLDTAWPYHAGESEKILGRALADGYRQKVKIATKLPSWAINSREDMDRYLNLQLKKLGTETIDYYLLHGLNGNLWDDLAGFGAAGFLDTALADGRIKNAGFSFHGQLKDFKRIVDAYPWTFCQIQYNFLDQQNQAGTEGLEYAAAKKLGVIIMEPLRGGNLGEPNPPTAVEEIWKRARIQRPPVEWALRWVWNRPEVTVLLSGMNEEAHIEENLAIAAQALPNSLTDDEIELVEEAALKYRMLMKVGCTGCGYCMPCPSDVNIPRIFDIYNKMHMFGDAEEARFRYAVSMGGLLSKTSSYASQCIQCGECVEKCPQYIEIPDLLEIVAEEMEDADLEKRIAIGKKMLNVD